MSPALIFELLRFEATPVSAAVALVELDGHFDGPAPERPRLRVETGAGVVSEHPAVQAGGTPWSATFAVPLDALADPDADFDLVPGRGPLIALPTPTPAGGDEDRFVELARSANDLRHRLGEATEAAAAADDRLAATSAERDDLAEQLEALREKLAAAETRVEESHAAALEAREAQAGAEGEAEQAQDALARAREEAEAAVRAEIDAALAEAEAARSQLTEAQDRQIAAEDEARAARHALVEARARIEALVREQRNARLAAARTQVAAAARRATDAAEADFRASRLGGPDWRGETADEAAPEPEPTPSAAEGAPSDEPPEPATAGGGEDDTAALEPVAGEAATTVHLKPVETGNHRPHLWKDDEDDGVHVLRPRTIGARRLPAVHPLGDAEDGEEALDPATAGARTITPAASRHMALEILTSPRTIVAAIFILLIVALVLIINGAGPV